MGERFVLEDILDQGSVGLNRAKGPRVEDAGA